MKTEEKSHVQQIEFVIGLAGLILATLGWSFDHAENIPWVIKIFAPRYVVASEAYARMFVERTALKSSDSGFNEISEILSGKLTGSGDLTIASIKIEDFAWSVLSTNKGMESTPTVTVEIVLRDGRSVKQSDVVDLRPEIRKSYLEDSLFQWGKFIFWAGMALSFFVLCRQTVKAKKA